MRKLFFTGVSLILFLIGTTAIAQTRNISGKVTSFEESLGLEGVTIQVKGTKKNSGTQSDGTYTIIIAAEDKVLIFSLDGYQTVELSLPSAKGYDIVLKRNDNSSSVNAEFPFLSNKDIPGLKK